MKILQLLLQLTIASIHNYFGTKTRVEFKGSYSKQDKMMYDHGNVVSIYIVYEINKNYDTRSCPTLENCLFGAVTLTKNADIDKYNYSDVLWDLTEKGFFCVLVMELVKM